MLTQALKFGQVAKTQVYKGSLMPHTRASFTTHLTVNGKDRKVLGTLPIADRTDRTDTVYFHVSPESPVDGQYIMLSIMLSKNDETRGLRTPDFKELNKIWSLVKKIPVDAISDKTRNELNVAIVRQFEAMYRSAVGLNSYVEELAGKLGELASSFRIAYGPSPLKPLSD